MELGIYLTSVVWHDGMLGITGVEIKEKKASERGNRRGKESV